MSCTSGGKGKVVALPIEIKSRELMGKLWLGLKLLDHGHRVVIGDEDSMKPALDVIEPDVFFVGPAAYSKYRHKLCQRLNRAGVAVAFLDNEGGIFPSDDLFVQNRLSDRMLKCGDVYFTWGRRQAELVERKDGYSPDNVVVSGDPRFDLLQRGLRDVYREDADQIRETHGEFLLVNTSFTVTNHANSEDPMSLSDPQEYRTEAEQYQQELVYEFVDMIGELAEAFPTFTIVIRPHPSEAHGIYREVSERHDNVTVEHDGDVRSWILASNAVIHNSCTTGIESALLNAPLFAFRPVKDEKFDMRLPNLVSEDVPDVERLVDRIEWYLTDPSRSYELDTEQRESLREYISNIHGVKAAERIAEAVTSLPSQEQGGFPSPGFGQFAKRATTRYLGDDAMEAVLEIATRDHHKYKRQKFPGLAERELIEKSRFFEAHVDYDVSEITVRKMPALVDVFELSRKG